MSVSSELYVCTYCEAVMRDGVCRTCNDYKGAVEFDDYYESLGVRFAEAGTEYLVHAFTRNWRRAFEQTIAHQLNSGDYDVDAYDVATDTVIVVGRELGRRGLPACDRCGSVGLHDTDSHDA
jgi:hypothetical protein